MRSLRLIYTGLLLLGWLCCSFSGQAQSSIPQLSGARAHGLGYIYTTMSDVQAALGNQAGLTNLEGWSLLATAEQRYLDPGIGVYAFAAATPIGKMDAVGLQIKHVGVEGYAEQKFGLSYARRLGKGLSAAVQFQYYHFAIPEYGNTGRISFEAGLQYQLGKQVLFGMHVSNPVAIDLPDSGTLPTVLALGLVYSPVEKVRVFAEAEKDIDFDLNLKAGVEYMPVKQIALRLGFNSNPGLFTLGVGYRFGRTVYLDIANSFHPQLGLSPSFSAGYSKTKTP